MLHRVRMIALALAAGVGLSGCTYGDYGYGGMSVGYGGGYGSGYYDDFGGGYGNAFGSPYWGWFGDYYYPGSGYYVYDRYRRPFRWNDRQRGYWLQRRQQWRGDRGGDRPRWDGWNQPRPGVDGRPGRPGFDRRPGFQNVPRGSSQSPFRGRRGARGTDGVTPGVGTTQPDLRRRDGVPGATRPDFRRPDGVPGAGQPNFRRPEGAAPGAGRGGFRRPDGTGAGRGGFRRPDGGGTGGGRSRGRRGG